MSERTEINLADAKTIVDVLQRRADWQAARVVYTWLDAGHEAENWTIADLDRRARIVAGQLRQTGARGERALLLYPPGLAFVAAFFGCLYAGKIAVPASLPRPRKPEARLQSIVRDSQPDLLLTVQPILVRKANYVADNPELGRLEWLATDEPTSEPVDRSELPVLEADDTALLQFTSGSTADPKGVVITHKNLLANQAMIAHGLNSKILNSGISASLSDSVYVNWLPTFHDFGLIGPIMSSLYLGCRSVNLAPFAFLQKPLRWLEAVTRYRGTWIGAPNFAYDLCVSKIRPEEREKLDLSSLHLALNAAEPVRVETLERFADAFEPCGFHPDMFTPTYGLAEATVLVTAGVDHHRESLSRLTLMEGNAVRVPPDDPNARKLASCGVAGRETGVYIVDPETLVECEPARVGEIWVEGPHVSPGYWNKPEQTRATFQGYMTTGRGPFLRTGDLGFVLDGRLFVTGRLKELIIIRGQNHFPPDIERTVEASHPALEPGAAAAFGVDMGTEELLVVAQEVKRGAERDVEIQEVTAAVRMAVAREHGLALDGLLLVKPQGISRTTSGKIRRLAIRKAFLDGTLNLLDQWRSERLQGERRAGAEEDPARPRPRPFTPSDNRENNVTQFRNWISWRIGQLPELQGQNLDLKRPFAEYGLDSLVSVQLVIELAEWSGQHIGLAKLWELSTIDELVEYLVENRSQQRLPDPSTGLLQQTPSDRISGEEAGRLLDKMEDLSEAEIDRLLATLEPKAPESQ